MLVMLPHELMSNLLFYALYAVPFARVERKNTELHFADSTDTKSVQDPYMARLAWRLPVLSDLLYRQDTRIILTIVVSATQLKPDDARRHHLARSLLILYLPTIPHLSSIIYIPARSFFEVISPPSS